ncbi:MAG: hypothetical protein J6C84_00835 [Lachnospiraceae bacterium]|nr:hypothetical protein [Lachnospiraceae bacterium]
MKSKIIRTIINHVFLLVGGALLGLLLLLLVYCLPTAPIKEHVYLSLPMLEREFETENLLEEFPATFMGGFTDCLMLQNAIYESEEHSTLEQVLRMYRGESGTGEGWAPGYSLIDYLEGTKQPREEAYSRYWHGYLVVLRPMLFLTTFTSLRVLAAWVQLVLVGAVLLACSGQKETFLGWAFLLSVPFLYYFCLYTSLSLSICFYVLTVALIVQLKADTALRRRGWYGYFFLLVGMAAAYFDFLTYPLVTLGFPLCVYLYLGREDWKRTFRGLAAGSLEWGLGYLGLWSLKWVIADLFTGSSTVKDGVATLLERTGRAEEQSVISGFLSVVGQNMSVYGNWGFYLLILGILFWLGYQILRNRNRITGDGVKSAGILLLVALYPFVWFFFTQNHSMEHWVYTYKILSVTVFAGICAVGRMFCREEDHGE